MTSARASQIPFKFPFFARVLVAIALGVVLGLSFGTRPYLFGLSNLDLGQLGMLIIRLLKTLATPLVGFAILDALLRTSMSLRHGGKLLLICTINVSVAMCIGLGLMDLLEPGRQWSDQLEAPALAGDGAQTGELLKRAHEGTLSFLANLDQHVPKNALSMILDNDVIAVALSALLAGLALRRVRENQRLEGRDSSATLERFVEATYETLLQMLHWVVGAVPFAVFGVMAKSVGQYGLEVFRVIWVFPVVILLGFLLHALVYYPLAAWVLGGRTPREYLGHGLEAILTGFSTNSSLATVNVTLRCLTEKLGVSETSARLSACLGTNLNNDGITLYEAMAALFLAQAAGMSLTLGQQLTVVAASLMAGIGVAGIPEAGIIMLPLVLGAAGLPDTAIAHWLPLLLSVDWLLARCRSVVNVMSDMLVAILLDGRPARVPAPASQPPG